MRVMRCTRSPSMTSTQCSRKSPNSAGMSCSRSDPRSESRLRPRVGGDALRSNGVAAQKRLQSRRQLGGMCQRQGVVGTGEHHIFSLR
jgi:hypothetical protein